MLLQGPKLPPEVTFEVFQHSEHLTAVCCLYYDCSAPSSATSHRAELLEALALASRHIGTNPLQCRTPKPQTSPLATQYVFGKLVKSKPPGCIVLTDAELGACAEAPTGRHITASDWAFSSPTPNLPLLMRGIIDACRDAVTPSISRADADMAGATRIEALTDVACATFRGARSARQAAAAQFGAAYEPRLERGSGGWLASAVVRDACMLLLERCLAVCGLGSAEWIERILQLSGHMVARCDRPGCSGYALMLCLRAVLSRSSVNHNDVLIVPPSCVGEMHFVHMPSS